MTVETIIWKHGDKWKKYLKRLKQLLLESGFGNVELRQGKAAFCYKTHSNM